MASFQVDAAWEEDPTCKKCGKSIRLADATHYCCPRCALDLGLRQPESLLEKVAFGVTE